MRVNKVRQSGKIGFDEEKNPREFYDRSILEQREITDPDGLKRLMREGVEHSSVVCVLTGTGTWDSRWVKYEIARAVIDSKGSLNIDINGLTHHKTSLANLPGLNPLESIRIPIVNFIFGRSNWSWSIEQNIRYEWNWRPYGDYTTSVSLPRYLKAPSIGYILPLSVGARSYNYVNDVGGKNIGSWIDSAASQARR